MLTRIFTVAAKIVDGLLGTGRKEFDRAELQILQETSADQKLEWQLFVVWSLSKIANQSWFWISSQLPKKHGSKWRSSWSTTPKNMSWDFKHFRIIAEIRFVHRSSCLELGLKKPQENGFYIVSICILGSNRKSWLQTDFITPNGWIFIRVISTIKVHHDSTHHRKYLWILWLGTDEIEVLCKSK